ncbi:hypothetical protein GCM10027589_32500 [Actinocorallia lasiicapitis]
MIRKVALLAAAGLALSIQTIGLPMQLAVRRAELGAATASAGFFRPFGGVVGVGAGMAVAYRTGLPEPAPAFLLAAGFALAALPLALLVREVPLPETPRSR